MADSSSRHLPSHDAIRRHVVEKLADVTRLLRAVRRASRDTPEELVHDLRVALRRADATLDVFRSCFRPAHVDYLRRRLNRLRRKAGRVRDLDVVARLLPRLRDELLPADRRQLRRRWRRRRARGCHELRRAARRSRRRRLTRRARHVLRADSDCGASLADFPADLLVSLAASARWLADAPAALAAADDRPSHEFRIRARRLRYQLEAVARLLPTPPPPLAPLLDRLRELQECLGILQDEAVARRLWLDFVSDDGASSRVTLRSDRPDPSARVVDSARTQAEHLARQAARLADALAVNVRGAASVSQGD